MASEFSFTSTEIDRLLRRRSIGGLEPWSTGDYATIETFYRRACGHVAQEIDAQLRFDGYLQGYASFLEAFFYRRTPEFEFRFEHPSARPVTDDTWHGLSVLLCCLGPYCAVTQGYWQFGERGSGGSLPHLTLVDELTSPAVARLSQQIQPLLEPFGLRRLSRADLGRPLPPGRTVDTNLGSHDVGFTVFDALFNWAD